MTKTLTFTFIALMIVACGGTDQSKETQFYKKQQTIAESWRCFAKVGCIKKGSGTRDEGQHASGACGPERIFWAVPGGRGAVDT